MTDVARWLADHHLFEGLTDTQYAALADGATLADFAAGSQVVSAGAPADRFHVVRSGAVAVEILVPGRGPVTIARLGPDDLLGVSWLFPPQRWLFDGVATEPTETIAFDAATVRAATEADHELGFRLFGRFAALLSDRLQATRLQLLDLYARP